MAFRLAKAENGGMAKRPPKSWRRLFLKEWREYRGLSQAKLGELIGRSEATISQLENGKTPYTQGLIEALAVKLRCSEADLLYRAPDTPEGIRGPWDDLTASQRAMLLRMFRSMNPKE